MKQKSFIFKLPDELHDKTRVFAFNSDISMAKVCRESLKAFLEGKNELSTWWTTNYWEKYIFE